MIFYIFLASLAVPNLLLLIPQFLLMDRLHLLNSLEGLILLYVASNLPFTIFLFAASSRRYLAEYEEAIRLEGAGTLRVLVNLIVPLSLPAVAVVSMFIFSASSGRIPDRADDDEFGVELHPSGRPCRLHRCAYGRVGPFFAASVIATVPVIVVFLISLRWFRSGVSLGAIR